MPGRTWVVSPDHDTLVARWDRFVAAPAARKPELLQEHKRDRTVNTTMKEGLPGFPVPGGPIGSETGPCPPPVRIGFRSFDRQFIIPDKRLINQPNPTLWGVRSDKQVYLTALERHSPSGGPATSFTASVPDLHHYKGSFGGRAYPLWLDPGAATPNIVPGLLEHLSTIFGRSVAAPDLFAYVATITAHPAYTERFAADLKTPGIRVPLTANGSTFDTAVQIGARVLWLHTFGERFVDPSAGRPAGSPRIPVNPPRVKHPIPSDPEHMPNDLQHHATDETLQVGEGLQAGVIENVTQGMWSYEVSGVNVLRKWFSYRKRDRERPVIGQRRISPLQNIQAEQWLPSYTTDLIDLLNVLGLLIDLEPELAVLLEEVVEGPLVSIGDLTAASILPVPAEARKPETVVAPPPTSQQTFGFYSD